MLGIHGKKFPCYECHVEVHGAGNTTLVLTAFIFFGYDMLTKYIDFNEM